MIVEFFGIPGCGKSTLAHATAERLRANGAAVDEPTFLMDRTSSLPRTGRKASQALRYGVANPRTAFATALQIWQSDQPDARTSLKCLVNWLMIGQTVSSAPANRVTFLDQGIAQAVWSVGLSASNPAWLAEFMELVDIGSIDAIVHVTAPIAVVEARLSRRTSESSRLNGASMASICRAATLADDVIDRFQKRGAEVHRIASNEASVRPRAEVLAGILQGALRGAGQRVSPGLSRVTPTRHAGAHR